MAESSTENGLVLIESPEKALEKRYIELLEKRIADLELAVNKPSTTVALSPESAKAEVAKTENADGTLVEQKEPPKPRIKRVTARQDMLSGMRIDQDSLDEQKKKGGKAGEPKDDFVITFREVVPTPFGNSRGYCEVDIVQGKLRDLLKETIKEYPGQSWEGEVVNMTTPFYPLVHNWSALETAVQPIEGDEGDTTQARKDLSDLLELIRTSPELKNYFKTRQSHLDAKVTTYENMWSIFIPEQLVYAKPFMATPQLFKVSSSSNLFPTSREPRVGVECWCYDWNGKDIVRAYYDIFIEYFRGTRSISELACYPLDCFTKDEKFDSPDQLREKLVERGAKYSRCVRAQKGVAQMFAFDGMALVESNMAIGKDSNTNIPPYCSDPNADPYGLGIPDPRPREQQRIKKRKAITVRGQYIIDAEHFLHYGGGALLIGDCEPWLEDAKNTDDVKDVAAAVKDKCKEADSRISAKGYDTTATEPDWSEEERAFLELLPSRFLGYSTAKKAWGQFSVSGTSPAKPRNNSVFATKLQLDDSYKDMISALVNNHASKNDEPDVDKKAVEDLVEGKGRGLVILLHGPPGVGKTLTAETIAEATGKPLFVVSVAEIGLDASQAEKNLDRMFSLAGAWEAVLLVDEADVFLESRTSEGDAERNALVSVLLRVLEYYDGIMILTTNRINSLDVAVQSRIHLAVRYDDLKKEQKKAIFMQNLDKLPKDSVKDRSAIDNWIEEAGCEAELNGRQIRNVVSAALAVACSDKVDQRITKEHLKQVIRVSKDFASDLARTTKLARDQNEAARFR
ncbi:unnamed protein product [Zymoseptoria tritici ST99CH_3D7]|uniref:AAA+ ATPase domain-containing protein n=1 Tax=Zymoseptoria tritici (strain ST99CH_3D7) TaxID=1276538 RepID=A0A1X7RIU4_ZYMT9|nr:unnamed protein product [Zymoseptoria tritici ST99CH_3D7]